MDLKLQMQHYINGKWVGADSEKTRDIINPYNQEVIATVPEGDETEAKKRSQQREQRSIKGTGRLLLLQSVEQSYVRLRNLLKEIRKNLLTLSLWTQVKQ